MLKELRQKYGEPKLVKGKFISDQSYRWLDGGTEILLRSDWKNYRTRLSYVDPAAFRAMKQEQVTSELKQQENAY
ncbi:MAG: hypothetical protein OEY09_12810 [Gammaproteobacteria bacterium]|nr:hypothetical protein [Gammaproteobacteria bacterium]